MALVVVSAGGTGSANDPQYQVCDDLGGQPVHSVQRATGGLPARADRAPSYQIADVTLQTGYDSFAVDQRCGIPLLQGSRPKPARGRPTDVAGARASRLTEAN